MIDSEIKWTFGQLEARLAELYEIDDSKRTAFQSRLKNFHRLRYPIGFQSRKGKAALYRPGLIFEMALAIEMTQLGLPPERTVDVLAFNWFPTLMSAKIAANGLMKHVCGYNVEMDDKDYNPPSTFVFFDPSALANLTTSPPSKFGPDFDDAVSSYFYGGENLLRENIAYWTTGRKNRMSIINITGLIDRLAGPPYAETGASNMNFRRTFFMDVAQWSSQKFGERNPDAARDYIFGFIEANPYRPDKNGSFEVLGSWLSEETQIDKDICVDCLKSYYEQYLKEAE